MLQTDTCTKHVHTHTSSVSVSELSSPLLKPEGGHQRSESSSDSFVCISEATSNNDTHIERAPSQEPENWVYLASENSHAQDPPQDKEGRAELATEVQRLTLSDDLEEDTSEVCDVGGDVEEHRGQGGGKGKDGGEDSSSDWENWDD